MRGYIYRIVDAQHLETFKCTCTVHERHDMSDLTNVLGLRDRISDGLENQ